MPPRGAFFTVGNVFILEPLELSGHTDSVTIIKTV
jgi:hypothetical protein